MLIMAERVNHPPHYNAGGIECIDALEAATSGLQGIEAFCTANAIKYLWRWKLKNGEEDLQKAVWYINRLIQRAGADSAAGKELFNMKENKHGFEPKQEFTMGGIGLITCEEYRLLRGNIPALPDRWWWTATPDSPVNSFVRSVNSDGSLNNSNAYFGNYGVRPLCNLKSEILVSYLNGENAEEQKKRAEAVDMMKHIAAAWDIDAEEVFGRADE